MKLWTGIVTEKIQESKDFYTRLFGCEVVFESDWFILLQLGESELGFMLPDLESQSAAFKPAFQGQGVWVAIDVEDVDQEYQRIKAMDAAIVLDVRDEPWGDRHFVLFDPNGVGVDVVQHVQ